MALACACSVALTGAAGRVIEIEADIADGPADMSLAGLPDTARDRIRAASTAASSGRIGEIVKPGRAAPMPSS